MKIAKAETILLSLPFEAGGTPPWSFGGKPANSFDVLLVRLETETGLAGWGEAFSRGRDVALKQTVDTRLLPLIIGRDASQISKIKHDLEFQLHNFGRIGGIKYGIAAIDILALSIQLVQLVRDAMGVCFVVRDEELDASHRRSDAADGIQAGSQNEARASRRDRLCVETTDMHERSQAGVRRLCEQA